MREYEVRNHHKISLGERVTARSLASFLGRLRCRWEINPVESTQGRGRIIKRMPPAPMKRKGIEMRILKAIVYAIYAFFMPGAFDGYGREKTE